MSRLIEYPTTKKLVTAAVCLALGGGAVLGASENKSQSKNTNPTDRQHASEVAITDKLVPHGQHSESIPNDRLFPSRDFGYTGMLQLSSGQSAPFVSHVQLWCSVSPNFTRTFVNERSETFMNGLYEAGPSTLLTNTPPQSCRKALGTISLNLIHLLGKTDITHSYDAEQHSSQANFRVPISSNQARQWEADILKDAHDGRFEDIGGNNILTTTQAAVQVTNKNTLAATN